MAIPKTGQLKKRFGENKMLEENRSIGLVNLLVLNEP